MKPEQQKQAESLYFQTDLSKTEIAKIIGISRRSLHYWVRHNNWDRIKDSARIMPVNLAGNCYLIMANLREHILSPERGAANPVTLQEVNALNKLINTISKLSDRGTLNENLEMMTYFMEFVNRQSPRMAEMLKPLISEYISCRAGELAEDVMPLRPAVAVQQTPAEERLDLEDIAAWTVTSTPGKTAPAQPAQPASQHPTPNPTEKEVTPEKTETPVSQPNIPIHQPKHYNRATRRQMARNAAA